MTISPECLSTFLLSAIKGLGLKTFHHLLHEFGSVKAMLAANYSDLAGLGIRPAICESICDLAAAPEKYQQSSDVVQLQAWASVDSHHVFCIEDASYPALLKEIYCPPPILYLDGRLDAFSMPAIAMVGSRHPSIAGRQHAFVFARDLSQAGLCVNSGLALGIDAASHQGVVDAGGITCAVMGTGLDVIYPRQHVQLADNIRERGALVSEMPLGSKPVPANFPRRNRIISGLSQSVFVVEASVKSGSLITARYALEQNREVFAMPGAIDNPMSRGCHALIKQGAKLVEAVEDILEDWQIDYLPVALTQAESETTSLGPLSVDERSIVSLLNYECVSFDLLAVNTGLDISKLTHALIGLELKGVLCSVPGGYQRVKDVK